MKHLFIAYAVMLMVTLSSTVPCGDPPAESLQVSDLLCLPNYQPHAMVGDGKNDLEFGRLVDLDESHHLVPLMNQIRGPVVLDFHADWSHACCEQDQILSELVRDGAQSDLVVIKIDVDQHPRLAKQYQANTLPKLVVIDHGKLRVEHEGIVSKDTLMTWAQPIEQRDLKTASYIDF